ncbi:hypothetical protein [Streptomyces subrutilus]|uniref:hypothetical protein n=1 Tax=Streptomyces subrutilus TaxID=36818 RepID=UPI002E0DF1F1|nr:hypothetical protein OG479_31430 [Streptomyces subrutilus]
MTRRAAVRELLEEHGRTHAGEAGIRMRGTPAPLYQLLVLCVLFSVRIRADIAVAAARELFAAGLRPAFEERALHAAAELGLPKTPGGLARLVDAEDLPKLAAALVRAGPS